MYKLDLPVDEKEQVKIQARRARDEARKERIFNPKNRAGTDLEALKKQMAEKEELRQIEKQREALFGRATRPWVSHSMSCAVPHVPCSPDSRRDAPTGQSGPVDGAETKGGSQSHSAGGLCGSGRCFQGLDSISYFAVRRCWKGVIDADAWPSPFDPQADLEFNKTQQTFDKRREFDLNDPDYLKISQAPRKDDDDIANLGPSSMQVFAGEVGCVSSLWSLVYWAGCTTGLGLER